MVPMKHHLLLTFDVEDFINTQSIGALSFLLKLLRKYNIRALFFVTGHMAEKLCFSEETVHSLGEHELGFHSSAHSVRPAIFEYCDVERYEDAYRASLERETSHINPLSGEAEGKGGIHTLRDLFPSKNIIAYRAPGYCCPPPHLEAMVNLGIKYDFSWSISKVPVNYRQITFYPRPIFSDCETALLAGDLQTMNWATLMRSIALRVLTVLNFHPHSFVERDYWDSVYHRGNPAELKGALPRDSMETQRILTKLEVLLKRIHHLEESGAIDTSPDLMKSKTDLDTAKLNIDKLANDYSFWPKAFFDYQPRYIHSQLLRFFDLDVQVDN
jgi:hypothetical protein